MEILKDENTYKCKTYLKIIQMTDLTEADYLSLKEIHQLANEVHEHIQDKNLKKTAKKFVETIFGQLEKMPEYLEEQRKQVKKKLNFVNFISVF
jgi:predicted house-cleaning noncanonical NTP pyrophosphatase (MazG superfamily)